MADELWQERVKLRGLDDIVERDMLVDGVSVHLVSRSIADAGDSSFAAPVVPVGREIPLARRRLSIPKRFDGPEFS